MEVLERDLVAAAAELGPTLAEHGAQAERDGRLAPDARDALREALGLDPEFSLVAF